ncbi:MAG TPA: helix-turn-helix domain-containing protein [Solirubrobacteraceae bacterium]|nr:helix-turn-helix domain-containing protein [Solirubrobacteraceae bacterium]
MSVVELLRVEEAARLLRIGRSKLYQLLARGELPVVRIGRSVRIPRRALEEWIEAHTVSGLYGDA